MLLVKTFLVLFGASVQISLAVPTVQLGNMSVQGRTIDIPGIEQEFFGAIPFALPPTGSLRFKPTVLSTTIPFSQNTSTFNASNFGAVCPQLGVSSPESSEDCLTINILRPSGITKDAMLPVLFWTYGGAFQEGSSTEFNASAIVGQSILRGTPLIYVNFNYRLGPLGFPQGQEAQDRGTVNLGIKDQIAALNWVQANIEEFGGDKNKVTAFGESAGAIMTSILLLSSQINPFARAAILESGSPATSSLFNASRRESVWQNFVSGVPECANLSATSTTFPCLETAPLSSIMSGFELAQVLETEEIPWDPVIDAGPGAGGVFADFPSQLYQRGEFSRIPTISGTNLDEGTAFTPPNVNYTTDTIRSFIVTNYSPPVTSQDDFFSRVELILDLYPDVPALGSPFGTQNETFGLSEGFKRAAAIDGDLAFQAPRRMWSQAASGVNATTYAYLFTQPQPNNGFLGVSHGSEIDFVYGDVNTSSPSDVLLSHLIIDYWVSFATSLTPNDGKGFSRPTWDAYTSSNNTLIQLNGDNTTMIPDDFREQQIAAINADPLAFHHRRGSPL